MLISSFSISCPSPSAILNHVFALSGIYNTQLSDPWNLRVLCGRVGGGTPTPVLLSSGSLPLVYFAYWNCEWDFLGVTIL